MVHKFKEEWRRIAPSAASATTDEASHLAVNRIVAPGVARGKRDA